MFNQKMTSYATEIPEPRLPTSKRFHLSFFLREGANTRWLIMLVETIEVTFSREMESRATPDRNPGPWFPHASYKIPIVSFLNPPRDRPSDRSPNRFISRNPRIMARAGYWQTSIAGKTCARSSRSPGRIVCPRLVRFKATCFQFRALII